jgi:hypothetical protein
MADREKCVGGTLCYVDPVELKTVAVPAIRYIQCQRCPDDSDSVRACGEVYRAIVEAHVTVLVAPGQRVDQPAPSSRSG